MDEVDLKITSELSANSRITIRKLADELGISVNSVHKRINNLQDEGIIVKFILRPRYHYMDALCVVVLGHSGSSALEDTILRLAKKGNIERAILCMDHWISITGHLRKVTDIKDFTEDIVRELEMRDHTVGLFYSKDFEDTPQRLTKLDYQICDSLANDSRKALTEVAKETGLSAKTVRRRMEKMEKDDAIYATIHWQPSESSDVIAYFYLTLEAGADKQETIADFANNYKPNYLTHYEFSNLPDYMQVIFWGKTMRQINDIQQRLVKGGNFKKVTANVHSKVFYFETWLNEHVRKMAAKE
jgi:DNA-binding Lrp family transcriptional regulator